MEFPRLLDSLDLHIPAVYVDRFACRVMGNSIRITFAETIAGDEVRHTSALVLPVESAQQLSLLLKELITDSNLWVEKEEKEEESEAGTNAEQP